jgi:hypothetical protein
MNLLNLTQHPSEGFVAANLLAARPPWTVGRPRFRTRCLCLWAMTFCEEC